MLIRQGKERTNGIDLRLACMLAFVAGALNTAAFYEVGFFSANMTGNVSILSNRIALGQFVIGMFFLGMVALFIAGAAGSTLLINAGRRRGIPGIYAFSVLAEAVLLALLGWADIELPPPVRGSILILGLSFLMGLQNALVTRISDARVRTTHVSGMATDIGIELAMLLDRARGREPAAAAISDRNKLQLHAATVASFLIGGIVGVLLYELIGSFLLIVIAAILLVVALHGIVDARRRRETVNAI